MRCETAMAARQLALVGGLDFRPGRRIANATVDQIEVCPGRGSGLSGSSKQNTRTDFPSPTRAGRRGFLDSCAGDFAARGEAPSAWEGAKQLEPSKRSEATR